MLAEHGAIIVDADAIVRELQVPGTDVFRRIIDEFGAGVLAPDGTLDREALAAIVFRDEDARARLAGITHPEVYRVIAERIDALKDGGSVVVLDVPLLVESGGGGGIDHIVVVEADEESRIARVVAERGLTTEQVRARMATQASAEQRKALADTIIRNDGSPDDLRAQVDALWETLR